MFRLNVHELQFKFRYAVLQGDYVTNVMRKDFLTIDVIMNQQSVIIDIIDVKDVKDECEGLICGQH